MLQNILISEFIFNYFMNLMVSENRILFVFSTISIFEYISTIPIFIAEIGIITKTELVKLTTIARFFSMYKFESILGARNQEVLK